MKPTIYVETTIASYLAARPSRDLIVAANQELTREWWSSRRDDFDLFVSQIVVQEVEQGDKQVAARRLALIQDLPLLDVNQACETLARALITDLGIPPRSAADALHVALAAVHRMDFLLTWNCTHIANATLRPRIESTCEAAGCRSPVICTPQELLER